MPDDQFGERQASDTGSVRSIQLFVDGIKLGLIIGMCAIGLSLMIAIGPDAFRAFLRGAQAMDVHFKAASWDENLPALLALVLLAFTLRSADLPRSLALVRSLALPLLVLAGGIAMFVLIMFGGRLVLSGVLTIGELAAFTARLGDALGGWPR